MKRFLTIAGAIVVGLLGWQWLNAPSEVERYQYANAVCSSSIRSLMRDEAACDEAGELKRDLYDKGCFKVEENPISGSKMITALKSSCGQR